MPFEHLNNSREDLLEVVKESYRHYMKQLAYLVVGTNEDGSPILRTDFSDLTRHNAMAEGVGRNLQLYAAMNSHSVLEGNCEGEAIGTVVDRPMALNRMCGSLAGLTLQLTEPNRPQDRVQQLYHTMINEFHAAHVAGLKLDLRKGPVPVNTGIPTEAVLISDTPAPMALTEMMDTMGVSPVGKEVEPGLYVFALRDPLQPAVQGSAMETGHVSVDVRVHEPQPKQVAAPAN